MPWVACAASDNISHCCSLQKTLMQHGAVWSTKVCKNNIFKRICFFIQSSLGITLWSGSIMSDCVVSKARKVFQYLPPGDY